MLTKVIGENGEIIGNTLDNYVKDRTIDAIVGCTGKNVYEDYLEFCKENDLVNDLTHNQFRYRLCRYYKLNTSVYKINGRSTRVIVKK